MSISATKSPEKRIDFWRPISLRSLFDTSLRNPEHPRGREGIDSRPLPPRDFVSEAVVVAVMGSAQGYGELVTHLESHRARLGEPQVVGVNGASPTDQTRLRCHKFKVGFIAKPTRFAERELAFIDLAGSIIDLRVRRRRRGLIGDG
jgi:hypothetical protein